MTAISQSKCYEIIQNFAETIKERKVLGAKPEKTVIFFRNEAKDGIERDVFMVPIECLRYRKYNGRILSDIKSYEANHGVLIVTSPPYSDRRKSTYGGIHPKEYVEWFLPLSEQMLRILKPQTSRLTYC